MTHCIIVVHHAGLSYYQAPIELMTSEVCTAIQKGCIESYLILDILSDTEHKLYIDRGEKLCCRLPKCLEPLWNKVEVCGILSYRFAEPDTGSWGKFLYVNV